MTHTTDAHSKNEWHRASVAASVVARDVGTGHLKHLRATTTAHMSTPRRRSLARHAEMEQGRGVARAWYASGGLNEVFMRRTTRVQALITWGTRPHHVHGLWRCETGWGGARGV